MFVASKDLNKDDYRVTLIRPFRNKRGRGNVDVANKEEKKNGKVLEDTVDW